MKKIYKFMLLPAMVLPLLFTSCDDDRDSNPTIDLSHVDEEFVLNTPALAENNTYDLVSAKTLNLTCTQPNYGGAPYGVEYYVQVSIDPKFKNDSTVTHTQLKTFYKRANMDVDASEVNSAVVALFQDAHPDTSVPEEMPVYIRLRAVIGGTTNPNYGQTFSNVITLPSVKATYKAPDAEFTDNLYLIGSSIQEGWKSWKPIPEVQGVPGQYYGVVYLPAGGEFKWGTKNNDYRGFNRITIADEAEAGVTEGDNQNIKVANAGWYTLYFKGKITEDKKNIDWTMTIYKTQICLIGACMGQETWGFADNVALTPPTEPNGVWVSPAFTASAELRVSVKVGDIDWYRTEFTINKGNIFWRNKDMPNNWAETFGADYSVSTAAGKKLYVNFDTNTAEVK